MFIISTGTNPILVDAISVVGITESGAEIPIDVPITSGGANHETNYAIALNSKSVTNENSGVVIHGTGTVGTQQ